jgi:hypothetical protein
LDNDGLTDLEEEIFGTDSGTSDTDKDGYYDVRKLIICITPEELLQ